jgi:predicted dehydrogenase
VRFETGAGAIFESGWVYPNTFPTTVDSVIELVGSDGVVHMDRARETLSIAHGKAYQYPKSSMTMEIAGRLEGALPTSVGQYLDAVLEGRQPAVTVTDGLEVTRIVAAIHQSLETGGPVKITR